MFTITARDWHATAACGTHVDDWLWFDYGAHGEADAVAEARKICGSCPVRELCLEDALETGEQWGIRAGMTPEQRRRFARNRSRQSRAKETA